MPNAPPNVAAMSSTTLTTLPASREWRMTAVPFVDLFARGCPGIPPTLSGPGSWSDRPVWGADARRGCARPVAYRTAYLAGLPISQGGHQCKGLFGYCVVQPVSSSVAARHFRTQSALHSRRPARFCAAKTDAGGTPQGPPHTGAPKGYDAERAQVHKGLQAGTKSSVLGRPPRALRSHGHKVIFVFFCDLLVDGGHLCLSRAGEGRCIFVDESGLCVAHRSRCRRGTHAPASAGASGAFILPLSGEYGQSLRPGAVGCAPETFVCAVQHSYSEFMKPLPKFPAHTLPPQNTS